jgi:hypothetical protein
MKSLNRKAFHGFTVDLLYRGNLIAMVEQAIVELTQMETNV